MHLSPNKKNPSRSKQRFNYSANSFNFSFDSNYQYHKEETILK